jgi:hypothetical protein
MNPGYAGRTELPDNLKARPPLPPSCAPAADRSPPRADPVPPHQHDDSGLRAHRPHQSLLGGCGLSPAFSGFRFHFPPHTNRRRAGFQTASSLAKKLVLMYKLCAEQLSKQDHYDFGMRAVKSVLVRGACARVDALCRHCSLITLVGHPRRRWLACSSGATLIFRRTCCSFVPFAAATSPSSSRTICRCSRASSAIWCNDVARGTACAVSHAFSQFPNVNSGEGDTAQLRSLVNTQARDARCLSSFG